VARGLSAMEINGTFMTNLSTTKKKKKRRNENTKEIEFAPFAFFNSSRGG
jgi:hypothetical protein